jgi:ABC-type sugar transport system, permease component
MVERSVVTNMSYKLRETKGDKIFNAFNYLVVTVFFILVLYPCIYVFSASISNPVDVATGKMWLYPTSFSLEAYKLVFQKEMIGIGYRNTLLYMLSGTVLSVFTTLFAAYALSRKDLAFRNFFTFLFAFTMFFNGGMIPTYLVVNDLHLYNTPLAMIIPGMLSIWNMIVARTFIQTSIPQDLLEAAHIDGCSDFAYFWQIILPLSAPIVAVLALFYAVGIWNQYFNALLYMDNQNLYPLQMVLRSILIMNEADSTVVDVDTLAYWQRMRELLKYALIVVASVPVLIIYPFIQKYFIKGMMVGAIKG